MSCGVVRLLSVCCTINEYFCLDVYVRALNLPMFGGWYVSVSSIFDDAEEVLPLGIEVECMFCSYGV